MSATASQVCRATAQPEASPYLSIHRPGHPPICYGNVKSGPARRAAERFAPHFVSRVGCSSVGQVSEGRSRGWAAFLFSGGGVCPNVTPSRRRVARWRRAPLLPRTVNSLRERFCAAHGCRPDDFVRVVFWRCLHRHAVPLAPVCAALHADYFAADRDLITSAGRVRSLRELNEEIRDFMLDARNTGRCCARIPTTSSHCITSAVAPCFPASSSSAAWPRCSAASNFHRRAAMACRATRARGTASATSTRRRAARIRARVAGEPGFSRRQNGVEELIRRRPTASVARAACPRFRRQASSKSTGRLPVRRIVVTSSTQMCRWRDAAVIFA